MLANIRELIHPNISPLTTYCLKVIFFLSCCLECSRSASFGIAIILHGAKSGPWRVASAFGNRQKLRTISGSNTNEWTFFFICEIFLSLFLFLKMDPLKLTFVCPKHPALTLSTEKKADVYKTRKYFEPFWTFLFYCTNLWAVFGKNNPIPGLHLCCLQMSAWWHGNFSFVTGYCSSFRKPV